jgi:hypothetical protein
MITQIEAPAYIENKLPEMKDNLQKKAGISTNTIYSAVQCLADFTRNMVEQHNYNMTKRCFAVAAKLHQKGNEMVKQVLENVYVYSLSSLFCSCENGKERNLVQAALPGSLQRLYVQQITKSGI